MALQVNSDAENKLLRRREVKCLFPQAAGHMTRADAAKAVSQVLNVDAGMVHLICLLNRAGTRDVEGFFYVYPKLEDAKKHLPRHIFTRMLSKEERKKVKEESKKPSTAGKPAAAGKK